MYNTNIISVAQVNNDFLPKIAREYNITTNESRSSKVETNDKESGFCSSLISTGWFSPLFSNNRINVHSTEESKEKKKEKSSPNHLQLIIGGALTAIATAFSLGRLQSFTAEAKENIRYSRKVIDSSSTWNRTLSSNTISNIVKVAKTYCRAETNRKNKLSHYQSSLLGTASGIGIGIIGAWSSIEILSIIGVITAVASATFGAYQAAIHWDDFAKAQSEFKNLNFIDLIPQVRTTPYPTAPGWNIPPHSNTGY